MRGDGRAAGAAFPSGVAVKRWAKAHAAGRRGCGEVGRAGRGHRRFKAAVIGVRVGTGSAGGLKRGVLEGGRPLAKAAGRFVPSSSTRSSKGCGTAGVARRVWHGGAGGRQSGAVGGSKGRMQDGRGGAGPRGAGAAAAAPQQCARRSEQRGLTSRPGAWSGGSRELRSVASRQDG
ncbi:MAG: hypothetical protein J3K34DRAFT_297285 [Monoraphidium minutum]|nr:MAG: hypothetical protein J3K34DRAFT_297285 [Monoraphidium minutum]